VYNDTLDEENINAEIKKAEEKIDKLKKLKESIKELDLYECGIRKLDNKLCFFTFSISGVDALVAVRVPQNNELYNITLDSFNIDYVPYSKKMRVLLPKRSKK
jgi:hypothetical protein